MFTNNQINNVLASITTQDIFEIEDKKLKAILLYLLILNY